MAGSEAGLSHGDEETLDGVSVTMTATSLVVVLLGAATVHAARGLGYGTLAEPAPGLWPLVLGAVLILLGLLLLLVDLHLAPEPFTRRSWRPAVAVAVCGAYVETFLALGPSLPTFIFMFCWLRWLSARSWRSALVVSAAVAAALYFIFVVALGISLPTDMLLGR